MLLWVQFLAIAACLGNTTALEPTHPLGGPIVPIPTAGAKLSCNYTLSQALMCTPLVLVAIAPKVAFFSAIIGQLLLVAVCLANARALEPTHPSSGPMVPILRAGTKLSHNYTLS